MDPLLPNGELTIGEASKRLGVSVKTLREWEKSGKIKSIKTLGGHRRFAVSEVIKVLTPTGPITNATQLSQKPEIRGNIFTENPKPSENQIPKKSKKHYLFVLLFLIITASLAYFWQTGKDLGLTDCMIEGSAADCISQKLEESARPEADKSTAGKNFAEVLADTFGVYEGDAEIVGSFTVTGETLFDGEAAFPLGATFGTATLEITDTGAIISDQNISAASLTIAGNDIINSNGKIPAINGFYFEDLSGENLTNVNAKLLEGSGAGSFLRSDTQDTAEAVITFTAAPGSANVNGGPLFVNPASASADYTLFGIAVDGDSKLRFDAEGDLSFNGSLISGNEGFTVDGNGNITEIRGITYSFPASQGTSGSVLTNNGSGSLTWGTISSSGITDDSLDFDKFTDSMTLDATTTVDMDTNSADLNFDSNTLFIDSSANSIGIGTTSPSGMLYVNGETKVNGNVGIQDRIYNLSTLATSTFLELDHNNNIFQVALGGTSYIYMQTVAMSASGPRGRIENWISLTPRLPNSA